MLKEKAYIFSRFNILCDLALGVGAFFCAYWLRAHVVAPWLLPNVLRPTTLRDQIWLLFLLPPIAIAAFWYNGCYSSLRVRRGAWIFRTAVLSVAQATVASVVLAYFVLGSEVVVSRGQVVLFPAVLILFVGIKTWALRRFLKELRQRGYNFRRVLLIGSGPPLRNMIRLLQEHPFWGFHIEGVIPDAPPPPGEAEDDYDLPTAGTLDDALEFLWEHQVDEVVFAPFRASQSDMGPVFEGCEEMGVRTHLALDAFQHHIARPELEEFEDIPVVSYSPTRPMNAALAFKYAFDRVAALCLLIVLSPVFAAVAVAIRLTSEKGAGVFYRQRRCGLNGKEFTCYKFRSMRPAADAERGELDARNEMDGPVFKIRDDPRVTRVGRFLRRTSMDELPQLYNVVRGNMSLVGPRPPIPDEVKQYDRWQRRRLSMRPGITCLWQVSGRNRVSFDAWMKLDLEYIDNWSLALDLRILLRTVFVVITGYGAM